MSITGRTSTVPKRAAGIRAAIRRASLRGEPGRVAIQAALAAVRCQAESAEDTDWSQILGLYDVLEGLQQSPVGSLNRAVAVAIVHGSRAALALIDSLAPTDDLDGHHLLHGARADLLRRLGSSQEAAQSRFLRGKERTVGCEEYSNLARSKVICASRRAFAV